MPHADIDTGKRVSAYWPSQAAARALIAEHGCRLCTWRYPGEIYDVDGDLWCHHCVREYGRDIVVRPALIPAP
jgi:hypothetical protein